MFQNKTRAGRTRERDPTSLYRTSPEILATCLTCRKKQPPFSLGQSLISRSSCQVIGESLRTSLLDDAKIFPLTLLSQPRKRKRVESDDHTANNPSGKRYDPIRDAGEKGDFHADRGHPWASRLSPGSPSSCRSTCFSDSGVSNDTDLTSISTQQGSNQTYPAFDIPWTDGPGNGPMLCSDVRIDEEARNLAVRVLNKASDYAETTTLPSQSMNFED